LSIVATTSPDPLEDWESIPQLGPSPGRWFGVPATLLITAPTRAAAKELADTIATERLPRLLDFTVKGVQVLGRHQPDERQRRGAPAWTVEVILVLKAEGADEARRDVERVCRRDAGGSHLFLGFGAAHEIEDQERLSPMCRRLLASTVEVLVHHLREDLADIAAGEAFEDTWFLSDYLPSRFQDAYNLPFLERWVGKVETVGLKLLQYPNTYLACTAEELAAHAILADARANFDLLGETADGADLCDQLTEEIDVLDDCAFEDHDILMAFEDVPCPADNPAIVKMMGIANFTPDTWFTPFRDERAD
jgi:hypothetical protein